MTTYTAIPGSDIDPESPITASLMALLRDNPIAITEGAAGAPSIATAALADDFMGVLLATQTVSAVANVEFTSLIDSTYDTYAIVIEDLLPVTSGEFRIQVYTTSWKTGATYEYYYDGTTSSSSVSASHIVAMAAAGNSANGSCSGIVYLHKPSATKYARVSGRMTGINSAIDIADTRFCGFENSAAAFTGIRFLMASGNISTGTLKLYGIK